jgi:asparagine synthase (glutamine-hydrolysing)
MCGIAGWVTSTPIKDQDAVLHSMLDAISHRGPDGEGRFCTLSGDGTHQVCLGHRRLAIIDIETGQQPMYSEDGQIALVFNGEIYNYVELRAELAAFGYQFVTQSDTEVLLRAYEHWQTDCVNRLRGMFAFALWDKGRDRYFMARDRFGKKPLYICQTESGFFLRLGNQGNTYHSMYGARIRHAVADGLFGLSLCPGSEYILSQHP